MYAANQLSFDFPRHGFLVIAGSVGDMESLRQFNKLPSRRFAWTKLLFLEFILRMEGFLKDLYHLRKVKSQDFQIHSFRFHLLMQAVTFHYPYACQA